MRDGSGRNNSKVRLVWETAGVISSSSDSNSNSNSKIPTKAKANKSPLLPNGNVLFHCDNMAAMNYLLEKGFADKIDLIYVDPPFQSGTSYFRRVENAQRLAFRDIWKGSNGAGISAYLDMIAPRLEQMRLLLSPSGSIFVHLDWHAVHYVKVLLDEVFGPENFRNEIIVKRGRRKNLLYQFKLIDKMHSGYDSILWYSKSRKAKFPLPLVQNRSESRWMGFWSNTDRPTMRYRIFGYAPPRGQWKWTRDMAVRAIENYKLYMDKFFPMPLDQYWAQTGRELEFIRKRRSVKYPEYWIPPKAYTLLDNIWLDVEAYDYSTGYGTQKHIDLLERIVSQFSPPGGLVADFFCGSGTSLVVAQRLNRRLIGCDLSAEAISVARKRLGAAPKYRLIKMR